MDDGNIWRMAKYGLEEFVVRVGAEFFLHGWTKDGEQLVKHEDSLSSNTGYWLSQMNEAHEHIE
jgi:hypothetical protein